jgi:hypothetical protein
VPSHRTKPQAASAQSVITTMLARADMRPLVSIGICRFPKCSKNCMARLSLPMRQLKEILHHPCERATLFCHNLHQIADNAQDRSWVNVHGHSRILSYPHCSLIGQGHPFRSDRHRPAARGLEDPALIPSKVVVSGTWFDQMLQLKVGSWPNSVGRHYPRAEQMDDIVVASSLLVIIPPPMSITAIAIKSDGQRRVLVREERTDGSLPRYGASRCDAPVGASGASLIE